MDSRVDKVQKQFLYGLELEHHKSSIMSLHLL